MYLFTQVISSWVTGRKAKDGGRCVWRRRKCVVSCLVKQWTRHWVADKGFPWEMCVCVCGVCVRVCVVCARVCGVCVCLKSHAVCASWSGLALWWCTDILCFDNCLSPVYCLHITISVWNCVCLCMYVCTVCVCIVREKRCVLIDLATVVPCAQTYVTAVNTLQCVCSMYPFCPCPITHSCNWRRLGTTWTLFVHWTWACPLLHCPKGPVGG